MWQDPLSGSKKQFFLKCVNSAIIDVYTRSCALCCHKKHPKGLKSLLCSGMRRGKISFDLGAVRPQYLFKKEPLKTREYVGIFSCIKKYKKIQGRMALVLVISN